MVIGVITARNQDPQLQLANSAGSDYTSQGRINNISTATRRPLGSLGIFKTFGVYTNIIILAVILMLIFQMNTLGETITRGEESIGREAVMTIRDTGLFRGGIEISPIILLVKLITAVSTFIVLLFFYNQPIGME